MGKALSEMSLEELWELFPIILKDHDPAYKEWFLNEKEGIADVVGREDIKRINHIGSIAVDGLIAKPTVDILLEVDFNCGIGRLKSKLIDAGWLLMLFEYGPDFRMSLNKGYTPNGFAERVFHLHVRFWGDWDELYFRDYLLAHKDVAEKYGELKLRLKEQYMQDRDGYTGAKTDFIRTWTKTARKDFGNRYAPGL